MQLTLILIAAIVLYGTYYEVFAAVIGLALIAHLIYKILGERKIKLPKSVFICAAACLPAAALISAPLSIDYGMAVLGFIKMLPAALFCFALAFESREEKEKILQTIPIAAAVITAIGLLSKFTPFEEFFYIQERFSGNFQYANSYALFLLVSIIILLYSNRNGWIRAALCMLLAYGIWETGSRSVGLLTLISLVIWSLSLSDKKKKYVLLLPVCALILIGAGLLTESRWGDYSLLSSSFVSRLFYNFDGMKMLLSHPLGLGYKGFLFYQGAVQTANYSATYAHNELLQAGLDFGWIPAAALFAGACAALFKKRISLRNRSLLAVIFAHSLFDWDMQFTALLMVLLLIIALDTDENIEVSVSRAGKAAAAAAGSLAVCACLWLGTAAYFEYAGNYHMAAKVYPGLTTSQMKLINEAGASERIELAESICSRNDYCVIALQSLAENAVNEGRIAEAESYASMAMEAGRYNSRGYEFYIEIMNYALNMLTETGDEEGAYAALLHIAGVSEQIEKVRASTSSYADILYNKPEIRLDDTYTRYLREVEGFLENTSSTQNN